MGWEKRGSAGRYYYRSQRVNGRVVKKYVGNGETAEIVAGIDALRRAEREIECEIERAEHEEEQARLAEIEQIVDDLDQAVSSAFRAALVGAGYHQHARGQWRKKRG
jgi:hypothetical protein